MSEFQTPFGNSNHRDVAIVQLVASLVMGFKPLSGIQIIATCWSGLAALVWALSFKPLSGIQIIATALLIFFFLSHLGLDVWLVLSSFYHLPHPTTDVCAFAPHRRNSPAAHARINQKRAFLMRLLRFLNVSPSSNRFRLFRQYSTTSPGFGQYPISNACDTMSARSLLWI